MSRVSWLHLTDLHRGMSQDKWLWPNVEELFFADLTFMHDKTGPWDLLLFSGDLAQSVTAKEFQLVDHTLKRLYQHINSLGSDPILLAVPGNHDLKRPPKGSDALQRLMRFQTDISVRDEFWNRPTSDLRKLVKAAFSSFSSWFKQNSFPKPSSLNFGLLPGDFSATIDRNGLRVGILGLNTSCLQLSGDNYEGRLDIHTEQLIAACGSNFVDWFNRHTFCVLVTHHPPGWLSNRGREVLYRDIALPGRFAVHLCGHMHEAYLGSSAIGGADSRRCWQTSSLFGLETYGEDLKQERRHGYSVGSLEIRQSSSATIRAWPRMAVKHQAGHWHFVAESSSTLDAQGGTLPEELPVRPIRVAMPAAQRRTYSVLLLATDHDLAAARKAVAEHLRRSLGVVVDEGTASTVPSEYDLTVLLQAWWWQDGHPVREWQQAERSKRLAFVVDENADWPPMKLIELVAHDKITDFRRDEKDALSFGRPETLPELVAKSVTQLMQSATGQSQIGLAEWERTYLEFRLPAWISGRTAQSRPHLFDAEQAEELYQPELYIGLDGTSPRWERGKNGYPRKVKKKKRVDPLEARTERRVKLARWLAVAEIPRLALVGAPGGGKTIFLTRIAASLASNCLGRNVEFEQSLDVEKLRSISGLPIPIVIEATRIAGYDEGAETMALVGAIKNETACGGTHPASVPDIDKGLKQGRYLILIDALDEIADGRVRSQVLTLLKGIAAVYPKTRLALTTRSARYTGDLRFGPEFETIEVAGLDPDQVRDLCTNWAVTRKRDDEYRTSLLAAAAGLAERVGGSADDQAITENPLMLTAICMVFERYRSLPDDRGRLCELLVDDLCRSRRSEDVTRGWKLDEAAKKDLLQRIALGMQEEGAQTWSVEQAIKIARQLVPATDTSPDLRAKKYVDWAADHTGILRFHEGLAQGEQVRFWHRIFREYLAASRIAQQDTTAEEKVTVLGNSGRLRDPFWEDVIRLLPRTLGTIEKAKSVRETLERLADRYIEDKGRLLGLAAAGIIENRDLFPDIRFSEMADRMANLYEAEGLTWRLRDRLLFLETLGRLDPHHGDPRIWRQPWIPLSTRKSQKTSDSTFLGSSIAQSPVTVQEFAAFVDSADFGNEKYWRRLALGVLKSRGTLRERLQHQRRHPNLPVVMIGVGEAIAYCRWQTAKRKDGKVVRLPTSSEWQSLLSIHSTKYWWGNKELSRGEEAEINWLGTGLNGPSPVGAFPSHSSGAIDLIGNVWEWCIATHVSRSRRKERAFVVLGTSYGVDTVEWYSREPIASPPFDFEYEGEGTIGFRCALADYDVLISSTDFSRLEGFRRPKKKV